MTRTRMDIRGFAKRPANGGGVLAAACAPAS
jgi:hypothetical protein